jgi:hypothetical protein
LCTVPPAMGQTLRMMTAKQYTLYLNTFQECTGIYGKRYPNQCFENKFTNKIYTAFQFLQIKVIIIIMSVVPLGT